MQVKLVIMDSTGNSFVETSTVEVQIGQSTTVADVKAQINSTLTEGFIDQSFSMDGSVFQDQDLIDKHSHLKYCIRY